MSTDNKKTRLFEKEELKKQNQVITNQYIYIVDEDKLYKRLTETSTSYITEDITQILETPKGKEIYKDIIQILLAKSACRASCISDLIYETNHDKLTGLLNRNPINQYYQKIKNHHNAYLIMIDIDDFKEINDNYGHSNGDIILKVVADSISEYIKGKTITACRYGGEEFVIIVPEASLEETIELIRKIELNIKCNTEKVLNKIKPIINDQEKINSIQKYRTVSVGIVRSNGNYSETIQRADAAMYYAKKKMGKGNIQYNTFNDPSCNDNHNMYINEVLNRNRSIEFNQCGVVHLDEKIEENIKGHH